MSIKANTEIIFQGAKCFWRTRNTVDIMIVLHVEYDILEIITYEPSFDQEAPRIYFDNKVLETKLDPSAVDAKFKEEKELILRRHDVPNNEKLMKETINNAKIAYILNRLFLTEFVPDLKKIIVEIQFNFRDVDEAHANGTDMSSVTIPKPDQLDPYKSPHYQTLLGGLVDDLIDSIDADKRGLQKYRYRAGVYENTVDVLLSSKDRWRIPIIYAKVNNGTALTRKDKKIWNTVTRGIKPELAKSAVGSALAIPLDKEVAAAAAVIPPKPLLHVNAPATSSSPTTLKSGITSPHKAKPSRRQSMGGTADRRGAGMGLRSSLRSSGGAIATGLNALSSSMKKRLGLSTLTTTPIDTTDGTEDSLAEGSPNKNAMRNKLGSKTPTTTAASEFIHPRGTNISITPKPRSYLPQAKPKQSASPKPERTKDSTATSISVSFGTDKETNSGKPGITSMLSAGLSAFSTSFKETFSFKNSVDSKKGSRNPGTAAGGSGAYNIDGTADEEVLHGGDDEFNSSTPTATLTMKPSRSSSIVAVAATDGSSSASPSPGKSPKGVHFTGAGSQQQQSQSASHSTPPSPAGKGRVLPTGSPHSGSNSNSNTNDRSNIVTELTPEQYRDRILQQQSMQTASSLQAVKEHIHEHDEAHHFQLDLGSKKRSPIEDFFNSMSPFGRSASLLPSSPSHSKVLPSQWSGKYSQ